MAVTTMPQGRGAVTVGVDTHRDVHVGAVLDAAGRTLRSDLRRAERASKDLQDEAAALGEDVRERTLSARAAGTRIAAAPNTVPDDLVERDHAGV